MNQWLNVNKMSTIILVENYLVYHPYIFIEFQELHVISMCLIVENQMSNKTKTMMTILMMMIFYDDADVFDDDDDDFDDDDGDFHNELYDDDDDFHDDHDHFDDDDFFMTMMTTLMTMMMIFMTMTTLITRIGSKSFFFTIHDPFLWYVFVLPISSTLFIASIMAMKCSKNLLAMSWYIGSR